MVSLKVHAARSITRPASYIRSPWAGHQQSASGSAIHDRSNLLSWQKWYCVRDTPRPRDYYIATSSIWSCSSGQETTKYNREKCFISRKKPFLSNSDSWEPRKSSEEQACRYNLL